MLCEIAWEQPHRIVRCIYLATTALLCLSPGVPTFACMQGSDYEQIQLDKRAAVKDARALSKLATIPSADFARDYLTGPRTTLSEQKEADAIIALFAGRPAMAINLLLEAEKITPGRYSVAATLGTIYEIIGQNQSALDWISESMRRNTNSHLRTEWVHVMILKAKLQHERDPSSPFRPLIELPEEFTEYTPIPTSEGKHTAFDILRSIHYQLSERMRFVKPTDPYVGDLLHTMARISDHIYGAKPAYVYIQQAEVYGVPDQTRFKADQRDIFKRYVIATFFSGLWWVLKALSALFFAGIAVYYPIHWIVRMFRRDTLPDSSPA